MVSALEGIVFALACQLLNCQGSNQEKRFVQAPRYPCREWNPVAMFLFQWQVSKMNTQIPCKWDCWFCMWFFGVLSAGGRQKASQRDEPYTMVALQNHLFVHLSICFNSIDESFHALAHDAWAGWCWHRQEKKCMRWTKSFWNMTLFWTYCYIQHLPLWSPNCRNKLKASNSFDSLGCFICFSPCAHCCHCLCCIPEHPHQLSLVQLCVAHFCLGEGFLIGVFITSSSKEGHKMGWL